jgi:nucleoside-diphosphate-sugar epimerase
LNQHPFESKFAAHPARVHPHGQRWMPERRVCVTGAAGLCGARLVEVLLEQKGCELVACLDASELPKSRAFASDKRVRWHTGDVSKLEDVRRAVSGCDAVYHIAALVGPFHPRRKYDLVNRVGSENVVRACSELNIRKVVFSSSPSTRMDGSDVCFASEHQLSIRLPGQFLERYAETKAAGEQAILNACDGDRFLSVAVAPHQVYGPYDGLFLRSFLRASPSLRVVGSGNNRISMTYVDNYCEALCNAEDSLKPGASCLGKFYIATDGGSVNLWDVLDDGIGRLTKHKRPRSKLRVPFPIAMLVARALQLVSRVTGRQFSFTPFSVRMLSIERTFDISASKRDLGYNPPHTFDSAWLRTLEWFDQNQWFWQM